MANHEQGAREIEPRAKQVVEREPTRAGWFFRPDVDIVETPSEFLVSADMPGVDERSVSVQLENGVLTLSATPAVEPDPAWTLLHGEYRYGGYQRQFSVSESIDAARIQASMRSGVLQLRLPKQAALQPRTIEVRGG